MAEIKATIKNHDGIHCRPTAVITQRAMACDGIVNISSANGSCKLGSALGLLVLALQCGEEIVITTEGDNDQQLAEEFRDLFETQFDFPPAEEEDGTAKSVRIIK